MGAPFRLQLHPKRRAPPGSTRKHKILCAFFQKRAIELQAAGIPEEYGQVDVKG